MPQITVTIPDSSVDVMVGDRAVDVFMGEPSVSVLLNDQPVTVTLPPTHIDVLCDDVIASAFTTPTIVSEASVGTDLGAPGARMTFTAVTAGSPCRLKFKLVHASASEDYATKYSSPEQLSPHAVQVDVSLEADRGLTYDLYWAWTSGNESADWELLASAVIAVPASGAGDSTWES